MFYFFVLFASFLSAHVIASSLPLGTVTFSVYPEPFQIGTNFLAKCEVNIEPKINEWRYRVTFSLNNIELAEYEVNGLQAVPLWKPLNLIPGVNIYPEGRSQYPFFYAEVQPLSGGAQGSWQCAVKSEFIPTFPSSKSIFYSNKWSTYSSLQSFIPYATVKYTTSRYSEDQSSSGSVTYTGECALSMSPNTGNYNVTFRMGRLPLGEFVVKQEQTPIYYSNIIWKTVSNLPGINVFPSYESASFPNFKILIQLQAAYLINFAGNMQCSLSMEIPKGGNAIFYSDPWELYKKSAAENESMSTMLVVMVVLLYLSF